LENVEANAVQQFQKHLVLKQKQKKDLKKSQDSENVLKQSQDSEPPQPIEDDPWGCMEETKGCISHRRLFGVPDYSTAIGGYEISYIYSQWTDEYCVGMVKELLTFSKEWKDIVQNVKTEKIDGDEKKKKGKNGKKKEKTKETKEKTKEKKKKTKDSEPELKKKKKKDS